MFVKYAGLLLTSSVVLLSSFCAGADKQSKPSMSKVLEDVRNSEGPVEEIVGELSTKQLISLLQAAEPQEAQRIIDNLGERAKPLPAKLVFEAGGLPPEVVDAVLAVSLPALGYDDSSEGVRELQEDLGESSDGPLTIGQFFEVQRRYRRSRDTKVLALSGGGVLTNELEITSYDNEVVVHGTWVSQTTDLAYPINTSRIDCQKERGLCYISSSHVVVPEIGSDQDFYTLEAFFEEFRIVSWTDAEINAINEARCRVSNLTINVPSKEVFEVTRNNWSERCEESPFATKLPAAHVKRLEPGYEATNDFWSGRRELTKGYFNSRLEGRISEMMRLEPEEKSSNSSEQ